MSPFINHFDKNAFFIVATIYGTFIYLMGRYPSTHFLTYCQVLIPTLFTLRYIEFVPNKWELMMLDFCYFQDIVTLYYITFDPKSKVLYKACYMNAFGILAIATILFGNKIIVSKVYEVTSMMIHLMPVMIMYVITDIIMVEEQGLPEAQRKFCTLSEKDRTFSLESLIQLIKPGLTYYSVWAISYYLLVLVIGSYLF